MMSAPRNETVRFLVATVSLSPLRNVTSALAGGQRHGRRGMRKTSARIDFMGVLPPAIEDYWDSDCRFSSAGDRPIRGYGPGTPAGSESCRQFDRIIPAKVTGRTSDRGKS